MCGQCAITYPYGRSGEDAEFFRLPAPYVLAGPEPSKQWHDVAELVDACISHGQPYEMQKGLVLMVGMGGTFLFPAERFMVMYKVGAGGEHLFSEASGPTSLFTDYAEFLAHVHEMRTP